MVRFFSALLLSGCLFMSCSQKTALVESTIPEEVYLTDTVFVTAPSEETIENAPQELPVYHPSHPRMVDLLHSSLDLSFSWPKEEVYGTAVLTLTPYSSPIDVVVLDAVYFDFAAVKESSKNGKDLTYKYDDKLIEITLDKTYHRGDTFSLYIKYVAHPSMNVLGLDGAITSEQGLYFIQPDSSYPNKPFQIWTQGETEYNSRWMPVVDKPNERATHDISLTVKNNFQTLSNGTLVSSERLPDGNRKDTWLMSNPHAPYLFMLSIGEYAIVRDKWKDVDLLYYVEKEFEEDAEAIFGHTPQMLTFFSELLDFPYPWDKYAQVVVRDYVSGAMENTTAVVFGEFVQREKGDLIENNNDGIVAHELMHHWFGDLVTCESWANLTLNEGFANYAEYLWEEHKNGVASADLLRFNELQGYLGEAAQSPHPLIHFGYSDKEDMFDQHSYNKGGLVLHMLRKELGDDIFFESLNRYLLDNQYSAVEVHNLRLAFEEVSGLDLNWFFNQWYLGVGHPILEVDHDYSSQEQLLTLSIEQIQDPEVFEPIFILPINIRIHFKDGHFEDHLLNMNRRLQDWSLDCKEEPIWVNIDPNKILLTTIQYKYPADPEIVYRNAVSFQDKLDGISRMLQSTFPDDAFYASLFEEDLWVFRYFGLSIAQNFGVDSNLVSKITSLAVNDPESSIRATAYSMLIDYPDALPKSTILKAIESDSSNNVILSALNLLYEVDIEAARSVAAQIASNEKSKSLKLGLIELSVLYPDTTSEIDFKGYLPMFDDFRAGVFFGTWASYALTQDHNYRVEVIEDFKQVILSELEYNLDQRLGAYGALELLLQELDSLDKKSSEDFKEIQLVNEAIEHVLTKVKNKELRERIEG